jgi:hypothetical protein
LKICKAAVLAAMLSVCFCVQVTAEETKTLKEFLQISMQPVGHTMYVWGGGWNEEDTAAGIEALTIGVSPNWRAFFEKQSASYNSKKTAYQIHDGLDCTGFIGWALYNLNPKDEGYVVKSDFLINTLTDTGWGDRYGRRELPTRIAGDIMGKAGHAWISLGTCDDGSVLILHSSPPGVALYGTQSGGKKSEAVKLAEHYMSWYYPAWFSKYSDYKRGSTYLTAYDMFRWHDDILPDPDGYRDMKPAEILRDLFDEND